MHPWRFLILIALLLGIFFAWLSWSQWMPYAGTIEARGQFGDSYGALNTLFAGVAFAVVLYSLFVQQSEANKRDLERHEDAVEARFFRMLESYRSYVGTIKFNGGEGKGALLQYVQEIGKWLYQRKLLESTDLLVLNGYRELISDHRSTLGAYFRMLYRTLAKIDESKIRDKDSLIELLRAELTEAEIVLIAFNGITQGGEKLRQLIIRYHLLKHIPRNWGFVPIALFEAHYPPCAFDRCN